MGGGGVLESVCPRRVLSHLCLETIFRTTKPYATKPGSCIMVHHRRDLECHTKRSGSYLLGQRHSAGSNLQKLTVSANSPEVFATIFGIVVHHHELESPSVNFGLVSSRSRSQ